MKDTHIRLLFRAYYYETPCIAVFLSLLADFSCAIMAYLVMASYFWKDLRNGLETANAQP